MKSRSKKKNAKRRPKSDGQTGTKKEKRKRKRTEEKGKKEDNPELRPPVSPLIYDPQRALQELLLRQPVSTEDGGESLDSLRTQLYEREAARPKQHPVEEWVYPSKTTCRFQLPIDFKELETLSPQSYLRGFCLVCQRRRKLYRRMFVKFDRDRDGQLSLKELQEAVRDLYMADVSDKQLERLLVLMAADAESQFDFPALCVTCALSERLFYSALMTEDTEEDGERDRLEELDFNCLMVRIHHYSVSASLTTLLRTIFEDCL